MFTIDELMSLATHYRKALCKIRDETVPFTREWRLANNALQTKPPKLPHNLQQLELFTDDTKTSDHA